MPEAALRFGNVRKRYGSAIPLQDVSFEVKQAEIFGLVGVNGAGKTTLLKCLLDFCDLDSGEIEIFGVSHRLTSSRKRLAFIPERFAPPYFLTGEEFIKHVLTLQSARYDRDKTREMLREFDLNPNALHQPVQSYSKGMTQKLGLIACFLGARDLFVLDEPASGLDPKARKLLKVRLQELKAQGRTVFLTSHALPDVAEICDRMAVLHAGSVRYAGTPAGFCSAFSSTDLETAFLRCIDSPVHD